MSQFITYPAVDAVTPTIVNQTNKGWGTCVLYPEGGNIRVKWDGSAPGTDDGVAVIQGGWLPLTGTAYIDLAQMIAEAGTVKVSVVFQA